MNHSPGRLVLLLVALPLVAGTGAAPRHLSFVTCPIVRDTSTLPCWLAEYEGELYYLGSQGSSGSAFYPPQLGHEALIEGALSNGPRICGGLPLSPVAVSVMREITPACNTVLPAEAAFSPAPSPLAPTPKFADSTREFSIPYDFDSDYLTLHTSRIAIEAARIAKAVKPARIEVRGQRGATLLSNGQTLSEGAAMGEVRARKMGENLVGLGVPADRVHVTWQTEPDTPDGVTDATRRRVTITFESAVAACDRACLIGFTEQYITALAAGTPASLPLAPGARFTENGATLAVGDGLWKTRPKLVTRRDVFADPASGQVALWGVLDEGGTPVLLSVRLKILAQRITEIETVVARKGSHALFAPETFAPRTPVFDEVLEPAQRVPRDRLIAVANGYFEGIEKHDSKLVSSAAECNRFENGVQMTNRGGGVTPRACALAVDRLPQIKAVPERRYAVVDDERGVVLAMVVFDIPEALHATPPREGRMLLLAEVFKIAGGEIQRIETVMHNLPYGSVSGWPARGAR